MHLTTELQKSKITNRKIYGKSSTIWKLNNVLLNFHGDRKSQGN